jgi:predicted N-acetyltransferase YhbS
MNVVVRPVACGDDLWDKVAEYAEGCSWKAGPFLARAMRDHAFTEWETVFVAMDGERIAGYCTLAKTDCVPDAAYTPYIGYVFVGEAYRGARLSERLVRAAAEYAKTLGFSRAYLVSGEIGLYEKYGFIKIRDARDAYGRWEQVFMLKL